MIEPDLAALEDRRLGYWRRGFVGAAAFALMVSSVVLPTIAVQAATVVPGRSLIPASRFFLNADPNAEGFSDAVSVGAAGLGISVSYLGLAFQQLGLITGLASFWVLIAEEVGRWVRRLLLLAGLLFVVSAATIVLGFQLLTSAGVPSYLGFGWIPNLVVGLIMIVGARAARRRLSSTWFWDRAELVQP